MEPIKKVPSSKTMRVGVIGMGAVGGALYAELRERGIPTWGYDVNTTVSPNTLEDTLNHAKILFLALPTPARSDDDASAGDVGSGGYDLCAIHSVLRKIVAANYNFPIIMRSTVSPGTTDMLYTYYDNKLALLHCPEFLSSASRAADTTDPGDIFLGMPRLLPTSIGDRAQRELQILYSSHTVWLVAAVETECVKVFCNTFYACKVHLFSQFKRVCAAQGYNYDLIRQMMLRRGWLHPMHTRVPGIDGLLGFGGACLPKDVEAMRAWSESVGIEQPAIRAVIASNNAMRAEKDTKTLD